MVKLTFVGHSTVLLESETHSVLTDPVFSSRVLMAKRKVPLTLDPGRISQPSVVVISHAHFDHCDIPSFKYFESGVPIIVPIGLGHLLSKFIKNPIVELEHGSCYEVAEGLKVTAFPVTHHGFRLSGFSYRRCNGYWIELGGKTIFFPGDTAYRNDFKAFQNPDLALLPIAPCKPIWFMKRNHLDPESALQVLSDLGAKRMVPIHWGIFQLGLEPLGTSIERLRSLVSERNLSDRVSILNPGEGDVL